MLGYDYGERAPDVLTDIDVTRVARPWEPKVPFEPETIKIASVTNHFEDHEEVHFVSEHVKRQALPHEEGAYSNAVFALDWLPNWFKTYEHNAYYHVLRLVPETYPYRWDDIRAATHEMFRSLEGLEPNERAAAKQAYDWYGQARRDRLDLEWTFKMLMEPLGMAGKYQAFGEMMHWILHDDTQTDVLDFIRDVATAYRKFGRSCTDLPGSK